MGVPGPVTSAPSEGVHELIRGQGAVLVTRGEHVLELVSPAGSFLTAPRRAPDRPADRLTERERQVLDAVPVTRPAGTGSVARTAGMAEAEVAVTLERLRRGGHVMRRDDGWLLAPAGIAPTRGAGSPE